MRPSPPAADPGLGTYRFSHRRYRRARESGRAREEGTVCRDDCRSYPKGGTAEGGGGKEEEGERGGREEGSEREVEEVEEGIGKVGEGVVEGLWEDGYYDAESELWWILKHVSLSLECTCFNVTACCPHLNCERNHNCN
mmetsp:Transcript_9731/g.20262  ORF Transcript_9731/g.20262 Transcript_9731/m.20262 type:complete len:139 (-) Transcript_9731:48-464(-)